MFFFNKEEVYIGYSLEEFSKIREILSCHSIKYTYRVINHTGHSRGVNGMFGVDRKFDIQYMVSVKSKDYNSAKYFANQVLHP